MLHRAARAGARAVERGGHRVAGCERADHGRGRRRSGDVDRCAECAVIPCGVEVFVGLDPIDLRWVRSSFVHESGSRKGYWCALEHVLQTDVAHLRGEANVGHWAHRVHVSAACRSGSYSCSCRAPLATRRTRRSARSHVRRTRIVSPVRYARATGSAPLPHRRNAFSDRPRSMQRLRPATRHPYRMPVRRRSRSTSRSAATARSPRAPVPRARTTARSRSPRMCR